MVLIIAEAGVNHNGNLNMAFDLVDGAISAGADLVKFQLFKSDLGISKKANLVEYQTLSKLTNYSSQLEMARQLELGFEDFRKLQNYSLKKGIKFFATPFDQASLEFLVDDLKVPMLKIPSGELTNPILLYYAGKTLLPLIISTGMSNLKEISLALKIIVCAQNSIEFPDIWSCEFQKIKNFDLHKYFKSNVIIMHCTSEYPPANKDLNLRAIETIRRTFGLDVGYSDHSKSLQTGILAVGVGSMMIEKHITLDNNLPGPDHAASLNVDDFTKYVSLIREAEIMLGSEKKSPTQKEELVARQVRKKILAKVEIKINELFTLENLVLKRNNEGVTGDFIWDYLGKKAKKEFQPDEPIF